jgi:hypothetical protein
MGSSSPRFRRGGKTFSSEKNKSKAARTLAWNIQKYWCGKEFRATPLAPRSRTQSVNTTCINLHFDRQKFKWPICQFRFSLELLSWIGGGVPGQSFVTKRSQSFASHRIHQATFDSRRFADKGSENSLIDGIVVRLRRPISKGSIRPKSCVGSMCCAMLTKLQSLSCLPKIELWEGRKH